MFGNRGRYPAATILQRKDVCSKVEFDTFLLSAINEADAESIRIAYFIGLVMDPAHELAGRWRKSGLKSDDIRT
jgi:hypothetical protein